MMLRFFNFIAWPPFTLLCPLYASIRAIESNNHSNYQACLTYWVVCSFAAILESMFAKLLAWFPFWPYAKGITILCLIVPYFWGASYIYLRFIRPYIYGNSQICGLLLIPKTTVCMLNEQNDILDAAESYDREEGGDELEKVIVYEGESKSNHDNVRSDLKRPTNPKKIEEWSCDLCLITTTSKKCLKMHFQGKKHKSKEAEHRIELVGNETLSFSLNQYKWASLKQWSSLFSPVTRSIGWCTWKKPESGWTKLNADGSVDRDNASFGGLLRDHKGDPICAYVSKAHMDDIFLVELWAIWRGLVLAIRLGVKVIWVESDSKSVVKTINKEQPYSSRASSCLKHIWILLNRFEKYKVSHSWRETNKAADHLSKMNLVGSDVVLWPADFPDRLCNIIKEDAQGRWYRRI